MTTPKHDLRKIQKVLRDYQVGEPISDELHRAMRAAADALDEVKP